MDDDCDVVGKGLTEANDDNSAVAFEGRDRLTDRDRDLKTGFEDFTLCWWSSCVAGWRAADLTDVKEEPYERREGERKERQTDEAPFKHG